MRDWTNEIEQAKQEVINCKRQIWMKGKNHKYGEEFNAGKINWFIATWDTGFVVCDYEELRKMPKRKREKILALGGIK